MTSYDLCVVGAGPGGFSAAIRAAQRGLKVGLVDASLLGGTCLNRGCIPARTFGTTARLAAQLRRSKNFGIELEGSFRIDVAVVLARKERILRRLRTGMQGLLQQNGVILLQGEAVLQGVGEIEVRQQGAPAQGLKSKAIILATGSRPSSLPGCPVDGKMVVTSDELLDLPFVPESLTVIGAGVIGCEFASYYADLGSSVTLIEAAAQVLPAEDPKISEVFAQSLKRRGVSIFTGTKMSGITRPADGTASIALSGGTTIGAQVVLMATGRLPQIPTGAAELGLKLEKGGLAVDAMLRTSVPGIFAVGDLLKGHQLAATASYEGMIAAENAAGDSRQVDYSVVPDAIYTEPEIASVGLTEAEAKAEGKTVKVSRLNLIGLGRAQSLEEPEGFVQVVAGAADGKILGAQIIGARATDLIGEAALAIKNGLTLTDLAETIHAHPTMSESLWEAASMALGQSIYYASR